ncbi:TIR domain-containing protein [Maridesulfovibrio zosterae]|uniref:TIR domain-containing protein n=1 Tax=Maridesulfovibrio zosterae TaxID=82171 RepID=UPI00040A7102|nr:TIR domain-containing protein [Maridesulfovibrio zosterae]
MAEKNAFISHYSKDDEHIQKLKGLLGGKDYTLKNSSIDSTKPNAAKNEDYIKSMLRDRIRWASTVVVLVGPRTHTRDWVNWEIDQAQKMGKRIVGVYINGAIGENIPEKLKEYGNALVGWTADNIIGAIEGTINTFINPDGSDWKSPYTIGRETC